jgi:hypothetical protein
METQFTPNAHTLAALFEARALTSSNELRIQSESEAQKQNLQYRGLIGSFYLDPEEQIFYGQVNGSRTSLSFSGSNVSELELSFHTAVDDYFEFCEEHGITPETSEF